MSKKKDDIFFVVKTILVFIGNAILIPFLCVILAFIEIGILIPSLCIDLILKTIRNPYIVCAILFFYILTLIFF